jgi:hypothetical protein
MILTRLIGFICFLGWLLLCICRVDLLQAFGRGTGKNRIGFSPLDVAAYNAVYSARLRGMDNQVKAALTGIAIPGQIYKQVLVDQDLGKPSEIWEEAQKWTRDSKLKQVLNPKEDAFSGIASMACLVSIILAFFSPKNASLLFFAGLVGMQTSLKGFEPSIKLTDDMGLYAAVMAAVAGGFL